MTNHITRFAPSPHGYLHMGHVYSALFASHIGKAHLRIEDIDQARSKEHFVEAIIADLQHIGFYSLIKDHNTNRDKLWRQSTRMRVYQQAIANLQARDLVYPCFCTRTELAHQLEMFLHAPHQRMPHYSGYCKHLSRSERKRRLNAHNAFALRLDSTKAQHMLGDCAFTDWCIGQQVIDYRLVGDQIIARKDYPTSYHLACVIDDAAQHVTLVTRGEDLLESTHIQRVLQLLLHLPEPSYCHHPLIKDQNNVRLAKRRGSKSFRQQITNGELCFGNMYENFCQWFTQITDTFVIHPTNPSA